MLVLAAVVSLVYSTHATTETFSVGCQHVSGGNPCCALASGNSGSVEVTGRFHDEIEETGWGRLFIQSPSTTRFTAFAAGYLEGALTAERIKQQISNSKLQHGLVPYPPNVQAFVETTDAWIRTKLAAVQPHDEHWNAVRFMYEQMDGLRAGANDHLEPSQQLSRLDVVTINLLGEIDDIKLAVNVTNFPSFENMTAAELTSWLRPRGHCTALVKLVPDGSELFAGHNTWWDYSVMLRIFKRYEFGGRPVIAMSSYPGTLASHDDYYTVDQRVIMETTISNYNHANFASVTPHSLPVWVRAMAANYIAKTGAEWMDVFKKHNSGTYNNMWMVVDYSLFTPGAPLPKGLLTVGEQLPGYFHFEDQTTVLSYGYWPSFNVAFYPESARLAGQDKIVEQKGVSLSYEQNPRAQVFRRDQGAVQTDADMQRILRYNKFQTDPLAHGNPCFQLTCRSDLQNDSMATAFGTIDAKYTSSAHLRKKQSIVISGPTHDDQVVFDWSQASPSVQKAPHTGQPSRFDFEWYIMNSDMESLVSPWQTKATGMQRLPDAIIASCLFAAIMVMCLGCRALMQCKQLSMRESAFEASFSKGLIDAPWSCSTAPSSGRFGSGSFDKQTSP